MPVLTRIVVFLTSIAITLPPVASLADRSDPYKSGAWHYKSIPCVDTTVVSVTPRLGNPGQTKFSAADFQQTGVTVTFKTTLGSDPALAPQQVTVTHYQGDADNSTMIAERAGDRVQLCFLSAPAPTEYCDPDKDPRGRLYRVWDYKTNKQYSGGTQHGCGGA